MTKQYKNLALFALAGITASLIYFGYSTKLGSAQTANTVDPAYIALWNESPIYTNGVLITSFSAQTGAKIWMRMECVSGMCSGAAFDYGLTANLRELQGLLPEIGAVNSQGQARVLTGTEAFNWGRIYPGTWRIFFSLRDTVPIDHSNELGPLEVNVVEYQHPCVLEPIVIGQRPTCFSSPPGISAAALEVIPEAGLIPGLEPIPGLRFFAPHEVLWRLPYDGRVFHTGDPFIFDGLTRFSACSNAPTYYQMGFILEGTELGFHSSDRVAVNSHNYPYEWRSNFDFDPATPGNQETIPAGVPPGNYMARLLMKFKIEAGSAWQMVQYLGLNLSGDQAQRISSCREGIDNVDMVLGREYLYENPNYVPPPSPCPVMNGWVFDELTHTFILEETRVAVVPGENKWVYNPHDPLAIQQLSIQSPYFRMGERRVTLAAPPNTPSLSCSQTIYPDRPTIINWQSVGENINYALGIFDSLGNQVGNFNADRNLSFSFCRGTINPVALNPGSTYEIQVTARDEWGQASSPASCQMNVQALPAALSWSYCPQGAIDISVTSPPILTWNAAQNAERYWLEIFDAILGRFLRIPESETSGTSFNYDPATYGVLPYDTQIRLRVAAANSASDARGEPSFSPTCSFGTQSRPADVLETAAAAVGDAANYNVAAVTEETCFQRACVAPSAPTKIWIENLVGHSFALAWSWSGKESDAQEFIVERKKDNGPWEFSARIPYPGNYNTLEQFLIEPGTYQYRIRALNSANLCNLTLQNCDSPIDAPGAISGTITINPDDARTPTAVSGPTAGAGGAFACSDGVDNDGDGHIDYPADHGCTGPSDLDELDNANGNSIYFSGGTNVVAAACSTPLISTPTLNEISQACNTSLRWNDVTNNQGYRIERMISEGDWAPLTNDSTDPGAGAVSYTDNAAVNNAQYRVIAKKIEGGLNCNSPPSNSQTFFLNCPYEPPDPCAGVSCNNYCDGTTRKESGACGVINNSPQCVYGIITPNSSACGYNQAPRALLKARDVGSTNWVTGTLYSVVGREIEIEGEGEDPEDDVHPERTNTLDLEWSLARPSASLSDLRKGGINPLRLLGRPRKDIERSTILLDREGVFEVGLLVRDGREEPRGRISYDDGAGRDLANNSFFDGIYEKFIQKSAALFKSTLMLSLGDLNQAFAQGRSQRGIITIRAGSPVGFTFEPTRPRVGEIITFTASSPDIIDEYRWDFGDGALEITTSNTIQHAYSTRGAYTVILEATDTRTGFTGTATANIFITSPVFREF